MKRRLGQREAQFLAYLQLRRKRAVRTEEAAEALGLSREQARELLSRLSRSRLVARVRPGLYLAPARLPLGGAWTPDEIMALNALMRDRGARYQICGPNAFNRYGLVDQVPARIYAYNDRISGRRTIGSVELTLIRVAPARLGATESARTAEGETAVYSSRARTLIDAVYDWSRFDSLPRAYGWIRDELDAGRVDVASLIRLALRYGDVGTIRRIGVLLERRGAEEVALRRLERRLAATSSLIPWVPGLPKRGKADLRWGVVLNGPA